MRHRLPTLRLLLVFALLPTIWAHPAPAQPGQAQMLHQPDNPLLQSFRWRSIGPANMGGRIDDIAVVESATHIIVKAYATGGVYKSVNNGITWESIFDTYPTASAGAVAISQSHPDIIWVGTGEANNRQSSSFGDGVYKSSDGGATFTRMGLGDSKSIARVVIHPTNPDIVLVAAVGDLFAAHPERGLYKTTDGGLTWRRVAFVNDDTGFTELVMDPTNPRILFAASYQRRRATFGLVGGGPGSGIWKSEDGGDTWRRLSGNGLPAGTMGRVAMDISRSNPNVVYAQIEVAPDRDVSGNIPGPQDPDPERNGVWRSTDGGRTWEFRSNHNIRPMYFSRIKVDPNDPEVVYTGGVQFYRSEDGGRTFRTVPGPGHVDHHAIWINPNNSNHLIIGNDGGMDMSYDRGARWESFRTLAVSQFYFVSADLRRPYWVYGGLQDNNTWAGPSSVRGARGIRNDDWWQLGGGDGFQTAVPETDPHIVFWESQNGNVNRLDMRTGQNLSVRPRGPTNQNPTGNIVPIPQGPLPLRWNWNTPIVLSPHNPRVVYVAGNRLFVSYDLGDTWRMSEDLTKDLDRGQTRLMGVPLGLPSAGRTVRGRPSILSRNDGVGGSYRGTITTLSESPVIPGVIWVGTDDGNVQVSRDGGRNFTDVTRNLRGVPPELWVSRVWASHADGGTAYVSIDGHRSGDYKPYVLVTRDYGSSWTSISGNLPEYGNVNVIVQDPNNPSLLYVGTEFGFFITLDEGRRWHRFMPNLPTMRIDHVMVHPRENDLILATHARGLWVLDDITPLQQLTSEILDQDIHLFEPREGVAWNTDVVYHRRSSTGHKRFEGESAPAGTALSYYLKAPVPGGIELSVLDVTGRVLRTFPNASNEAGVHRVRWNLTAVATDELPGGRVPPGVYLVRLRAAGREFTRTVTVLEDVWMEDRYRSY